MSKEFKPFLAHSELTDFIYIIDENDKYEVTEQCISAMKATNRMPRWIPVSEGLPEDNTLVLVTVKVGNREPKVRSGYYYMNGHFHIDNGDCWEARDKELIAWMPLPTPPNKPEIPTVAEGSER